ncbi:MAG TPA: hypothetical protein PLD15_10615, partial [Mesotoga sp.]|nr:hypothetical protein [Mesotoga sp.]
GSKPKDDDWLLPLPSFYTLSLMTIHENDALSESVIMGSKGPGNWCQRYFYDRQVLYNSNSQLSGKIEYKGVFS